MDDPREGRRLANKVNPSDWIQKYFEQYLRISKSVLDVGCGTGSISNEICRRFPSMCVNGVDLSLNRLTEAQIYSGIRSPANFAVSLASELPYLDNSVDFVYSRFLLEYLPDRAKAVNEMYRVCHPGGHVLLQDLDGQLVWHYPIEHGLQRDIDIVVAALEKTGFDPFVGRKLFSFAYEVGLQNITVKVAPYHLFAGAIDKVNLALWDQKLSIAMPLIQTALGSQEHALELKNRFLEYLSRSDTFTYSIIFTVVGTKPFEAPMNA